jgi:DMSO/TMAO reductase YedYZ molybdopterin-dependent catalytic subunit
MKPDNHQNIFTVDRRNFISKTIHLIGGIGLLCGPLLTIVKNGWAQTKRIILPKDTPMSSLASRNPAALDTRNLAVTPLEKFETMGLTDHEVDLNRWRLEITGKIRKPLRITYSQLLAMPAIERNVLLICPGFFTNHGRWKGISVAQLLREADAEPGITHVSFRGPEGRYAKEEQFSIAEINSAKIFLAYQVNGRTLPQKHGFPLRVVAEDHYGSEWVKFVHHIEVHKINDPK